MPASLSILYDHIVFAAQRHGGVSRYFLQLAKQLAKRGDSQVTIDAPWFVTDDLSELKGSQVRVIGRRLPVFPGVTRLGNLRAAMRPYRRDCDIFHSTWYPARPRNSGRAPYVVTVHDMIAERYGDQVRGGARQAALKAAAVGRADLVLCVSENTRADLINLLGVLDEKIRVTPLASSVAYVGARTPGHEAPAILYVGRRDGYKNFAALAQAFLASRRLRDNFRLVCFGGGAFSDDEQAWFSSLPEHGAGSVVQIHGDDQALVAAYRSARLFVCPSLYEGFGLPPVEAMSCGCPVLLTPCGSLPEIGADAVAYCDAPSSEAIGAALEQLLFDDATLADLSLRGYERAKVFSWEQTASLTMQAYREAIAARGG